MDDNIPSLDDLLNSIRGEGDKKSSSALAVAPKKPDDLVEEEINSQILSILGLEDVFDLTYEEYATLLKEAAVKGRMPGSQMTTESTELVTDELKRVRGKEGKFRVKKKKIDINKVMNRRAPSPQRPSAQALLPAPEEQQEDTQKIQKFLTGDLPNRLDNVSKSLDSVSIVLREQLGVEKKVAEEERKLESKTEKKKREGKLEKKEKKQAKEGVNKLKAPALGFFDSVKKYFGNILAGSVILSIVNWFKDPANQQAINSFSNFITEHAPLILGGLAALALLPVAATLLSLTTSILGGLGVFKGLLSFIVSPVGLFAIGTYFARKGLYKLTENVLAPGMEKLITANQKRIYGEGNVRKGVFITKLRDQYGRIASQEEQKKMTAEEKTTANFLRYYDEELQNRQKINDELFRLRSQSDDLRVRPKIKQKEEELLASDKKLRQMESQISIGGKSFDEMRAAFEMKGEAGLPQTSLSRRLYPNQTKNGDVKVIPVSHPDTGSGYGIEGVTDEQGRPVAFSKPAAEAFARMIKDSNGQVKGSDVTSSMRSAAKNAEVKGAPGSKHMTGTAMDIHGTSGAWIRQHGAKYGWVAHDYPGTHGGHFIFGGPGISQPSSTSPVQVSKQSATVPSIPSPTGRSNIAFLPIGGGSNQQVTSGSSASQATVPSFSAQDPNNVTFMTVKSIYNIIG